MEPTRDPQPLAAALSELVTRLGLARAGGSEQLRRAWAAAAGDAIAGRTRAVDVRRGVLHVDVSHAALLSELNAFHKPALLGELRARHAHLKIRDIKFRLKGTLATNTSAEGK